MKPLMLDWKGAVVPCYCGQSAYLRPNAVVYGKSYGNGLAWICSTYPTCGGYMGAHPDGRPLGTIVDKATKKLRMKVHDLVDPLWKNATNGRSNRRNRGSVYGWARRVMGFGDRHFHVGELTADECRKALDLMPKTPYLQYAPVETEG